MNKSYVMWNNKGGVGKSTITFHVASVYAEKNSERDVVVINMCPQANSSSMLMGGGKHSEEKLQELISKDEPQSIVGYITEATLQYSSMRENIGTIEEIQLSQPSEPLKMVDDEGEM